MLFQWLIDTVILDQFTISLDECKRVIRNEINKKWHLLLIKLFTKLLKWLIQCFYESNNLDFTALKDYLILDIGRNFFTSQILWHHYQLQKLLWRYHIFSRSIWTSLRNYQKKKQKVYEFYLGFSGWKTFNQPMK